MDSPTSFGEALNSAISAILRMSVQANADPDTPESVKRTICGLLYRLGPIEQEWTEFVHNHSSAIEALTCAKRKYAETDRRYTPDPKRRCDARPSCRGAPQTTGSTSERPVKEETSTLPSDQDRPGPSNKELSLSMKTRNRTSAHEETSTLPSDNTKPTQTNKDLFIQSKTHKRQPVTAEAPSPPSADARHLHTKRDSFVNI